MGDIAKRTAPGANIAHDHESRRAAGKTFPQIRTGRLFANRVQVALSQQPLQRQHLGGGGRFGPDPAGFGGGSGFHRRDFHRPAGGLESPSLRSFVRFHGRPSGGQANSASLYMKRLSRWGRNASAAAPTDSSTPRSASCVTSRPGKPQGLMRRNGDKSMQTFRDTP